MIRAPLWLDPIDSVLTDAHNGGFAFRRQPAKPPGHRAVAKARKAERQARRKGRRV